MILTVGECPIGTRSYTWWRRCSTWIHEIVSSVPSFEQWCLKHFRFATVHAWNYRRYVLENMPKKRPAQVELEYTTRKVEANFSNFSAWHQRSKVLTSLWEAGTLDPQKSKERGESFQSRSVNCVLIEPNVVPSEFELVKNAMYTDPFDQSVWIYHRWLIGPGTSRRI